MTTAVFFGFFQADAAEREHERRKRETKQKQKDNNNTKKKRKQTDRNISTSIIFVYTHIISIKDVRVEKILPREERRAGSRARATARLSLGE